MDKGPVSHDDLPAIVEISGPFTCTVQACCLPDYGPFLQPDWLQPQGSTFSPSILVQEQENDARQPPPAAQIPWGLPWWVGGTLGGPPGGNATGRPIGPRNVEPEEFGLGTFQVCSRELLAWSQLPLQSRGFVAAPEESTTLPNVLALAKLGTAA